MKNQELSQMFSRIADILEFTGGNAFKVSAYRRAARVLDSLAVDAAGARETGELDKLPGIGPAISKKIAEYLDTGRMAKYEEVQRLAPPPLIDLLQIQSLGPKTLALLHRELGVTGRESLRQALASPRVMDLPGMGTKKVDNIRRGLELFSAGQQRTFLGLAYVTANRVAADLRSRLEIGRIVPAGSLRRMRETVGDIDILASHPRGREVIDAFVQLPCVREVLAHGDTKGSVVTDGGLQVDLRVVGEKQFGAALQYFTGSQAHNVHLRELAKARGLKISEYGLFHAKSGRCLAGRTEEGIYRKLGLPWIPPEIREDLGEIEAAQQGRLPELLSVNDIRGDLHVHSDWSDGRATIEQMATAARTLGYSYLAVCDHSPSASYANGLTLERLLKQIRHIKTLNSKLGTRNFKILTGTEADIRPDGSLDFPDDVLQKLDVVVASVHSGFTNDVTNRMLAACRNPHVRIIGHPTGRLISRRDGYQGLDLEAVFREAGATGTALEVDSFFDRLDLNDANCRRAKALGCRFSIDTDAHGPEHLWMMELGCGVARRAWLAKGDVINTRPAAEIVRGKQPHA